MLRKALLAPSDMSGAALGEYRPGPRRRLVIVGAGGSGREVLALVRDIQAHSPGEWEFEGFLAADEPDQSILGRLDAPHLGNSEDPEVLRSLGPDCWYAVGIGDGHVRRKVEAGLESAGLRPATLIHPSAWIGPDVEIGPGSVVCAGSVITTNVRIGRSAQINLGCTVGHDGRWGSYVTLAQGVNVAGNVTIGDCSKVFTNAAVLPSVTIGESAIVGAGSVVLADVPSGQTVVGVPARLRR